MFEREAAISRSERRVRLPFFFDPIADRVAVDEDLALLELLQEVDAAQERGLARAARANYDHRLAAAYVE